MFGRKKSVYSLAVSGRPEDIKLAYPALNDEEVGLIARYNTIIRRTSLIVARLNRRGEDTLELRTLLNELEGIIPKLQAIGGKE